MMPKNVLLVFAAGIALSACARETQTTEYPANSMEPSSDSDTDRVPSPASNNIGGSAASTTDGPATGNGTSSPSGNPLVPNGGASAATGPHGGQQTSPMSP